MANTPPFTTIIAPLRTMPLSPEEEKELREKIQVDLKEEHEFRRIRAQQRLGKIKRSTLSKEFQREKEVEKIRDNVRREFYESNGYVLVSDEFGVSTWLTPEEAKLQKHKKGNSNELPRRPVNKKINRQQAWDNFVSMLPIYISSIMIAAVIGVLLVRSGG